MHPGPPTTQYLPPGRTAIASQDCRIDRIWRLPDAGVLHLSAFRDAYDYVASSDILSDEENRRLRMYFHARSRSRGRNLIPKCLSR
jgi:hypothetical protein